MANFLEAYRNTAKWEGGYTDVPEDNGNWTGAKRGVGKLIGTNRGITAWELAAYMGKMPTVDDMKNLPESIALEIYKKNYWNKMKGDEIESQEIANSLYDSCVNMGLAQAIKLAQRAQGLQETGVIDNVTLNALNGL